MKIDGVDTRRTAKKYRNVEDTFLPYDAVDAPNIFKSLHFEFGYFFCEVLNTRLIPLCYLAHFLYGVVDLHCA